MRDRKLTPPPIPGYVGSTPAFPCLRTWRRYLANRRHRFRCSRREDSLPGHMHQMHHRAAV